MTLWRPSDTERGAMKRDSQEANLVRLTENLQLCNVGDVSCFPRQDSWLEVGEMVDLHRTKGLTGMAAARTFTSPAVPAYPTSLCHCPRAPTHISML